MSAEGRPIRIEELLDHAAWLRRLALQLAGGRADLADDVVQDAWVAALERPHEPLRSPRHWLAQVVRNALHQHARRDAARKERERSSARPRRSTPRRARSCTRKRCAPWSRSCSRSTSRIDRLCCCASRTGCAQRRSRACKTSRRRRCAAGRCADSRSCASGSSGAAGRAAARARAVARRAHPERAPVAGAPAACGSGPSAGERRRRFRPSRRGIPLDDQGWRHPPWRRYRSSRSRGGRGRRAREARTSRSRPHRLPFRASSS